MPCIQSLLSAYHRMSSRLLDRLHWRLEVRTILLSRQKFPPAFVRELAKLDLWHHA